MTILIVAALILVPSALLVLGLCQAAARADRALER